MGRVRFAEDGVSEHGHDVFEDIMLVLEMSVDDDLVTFDTPRWDALPALHRVATAL